MEGILLAASNAWILDVVFFVVIFLGILLGVWQGFVKLICKIAGTFLSIAVAIFFCVSFKNTLEVWFGLETLIVNGIGSAMFGGWIAIAISFVLLIVIVRLLAWLFGVVGTKIAETSKALARINKVLGGLIGLFEVLLLLFFLLAVCSWIPSQGLHDYISSSTVVGRIFDWSWFRQAVALPGMI